MKPLFYSGTSGIVLPYKNQSFYPERFQGMSRLTICGQLFNSVEINSSFYKIPRADTVKRWGEEVSEDFRFTFKMWKGITHTKGLPFDPNDVSRFLDAVSRVEAKKGCLLIQLPPSSKFDSLMALDRLLATIVADEQSDGWRLSVEFRDPSWYREETLQLLESYGAASVLHDKNHAGIQMDDTDAKFVYLRLHGPNGNYRDSYDDSVLSEYSYYIADWLGEGKEVYTYFNNTMGNAIANLKTLSDYVEGGND